MALAYPSVLLVIYSIWQSITCPVSVTLTEHYKPGAVILG